MSSLRDKRRPGAWNRRQSVLWTRERKRYDRMLGELGEHLLEAVAIAPGERVADVGCGCGATTLEIADRVGGSGRVVGLDLSLLLLARAHERRRRAAARRVALVCTDVERHRFVPGTFDAVVSRLGMTYFDDFQAAFANLACALRASGRLGFLCWRAPGDNEWGRLPWEVVAGYLGTTAPRAPEHRGPFAFADPERIRRTLLDAGLRDLRLEKVDLPIVVGTDGDDAAAFYWRSGLRAAIEGAPGADARQIFDALRRALGDRAQPEGVVLGSAAWLVTARA